MKNTLMRLVEKPAAFALPAAGRSRLRFLLSRLSEGTCGAPYAAKTKG